MAVQLTLTDEQSDLLGYKRLKLTPSGSAPVKSDTSSLVHAVTQTVLNGTSIQCTVVAANATPSTPVYGDETLAWISEPLDGAVNITAANWTLSLFGFEATAGDHVGIQMEAILYHNGAESTTIVTATTAELGTTIKSFVLTALATATALAAGDRIVIKMFMVNVNGVMQADTATMSYNGLYPGGDGDTYATCPDALALQATIPANTLTSVQNLLRDEGSTLLPAAELNKAFSDALKQYSIDRQRLVSQYYSGDGVTWAYPLPRDWIWTFSDLIEIEYPATFPPGSRTASVGSLPGSQTRAIQGEADDWEIVESEQNYQPVRQLWFRTFIPDAQTNNVCIRYTTRHRHDSLLDTIPAEDLKALVWLAAAYGSNIIASRFAAVNDSSITADVTDYKSRHEYWSQQAAEFMSLYDDHIRGEEPPATAASRNLGWHTDLSFYDLDRLTHPRRFRTSRTQ